MKAILNLILENQVVAEYNKDTGNCALIFFFCSLYGINKSLSYSLSSGHEVLVTIAQWIKYINNLSHYGTERKTLMLSLHLENLESHITLWS